MTDVLFLTPAMAAGVAEESVGTLLLAAVLGENGLKAEILPFSRIGDPENLPAFLEEALRQVKEKNPKILSFYTRCDSYHIMLSLARVLKEATGAWIVFGGPQADISAAQTIRSIPWVDFVCCGEGEYTIYPFFSSLLRGAPDRNVPGLVYRSGDQVVSNPRPALIGDLNGLPKPDYSLLGLEGTPDPDVPFPVDVGRGCPFGCTYCSTKSFWGRKYRLKSPQRIVEEITDLHNRFGVTYFAFEHDMFTMNRTQVEQTCRLLQTLSFPVTWTCSARIDCLDRELVDTMARAGLKRIFIGIETGSPRMQKVINKNLNLDPVMDMLRWIRSRGIAITTSFIYGFPEETEEDISQTISLIGRIAGLRKISIQTHLCTFLPGTELSRKYAGQLVPSQVWSDITGSAAMEHCAELIEANPELFPYFREVRTPLRSELEFFPVFIRLWTFLQPVYQYLAEKYPSGELLQMYRDFVRENRQVLEQTKDQPITQRVEAIAGKDGLVALYREDPCYDLMTDFCRMVMIPYTENFRHTGIAREFFAFSPSELDKQIPLQEYTRRLTGAVFFRQPDGRLKIQIWGRK